MVNLFYRWGSWLRASWMCLVQEQRILDLGALGHCLRQLQQTPSHSADPEKDARSRARIYTRGRSGSPWHSWIRMLSIFNGVRFSDTIMGAKGLSADSQGTFPTLPRRFSLLLLALPLSQLSIFFVGGVSTPHPSKAVCLSPTHLG